MSPAPVPAGTAETLARCWHFRRLTDALPDAHELDAVLRFLLGRVPDHTETLEQIGDELDQLWALLTEDYDDDQLDELTDADFLLMDFATYQQECDHRRALTVSRLVYDIEGHVALHRAIRAEQHTPTVTGRAA